MSSKSVLVAAVLVALAAPVGAAAQSAAGAPAAPRSSLIKVGDAVRVTVWRNPDLSGEIQLAEDGTLLHPLYRSVRADGLTIPQLEHEVREILLRYEATPQFVVEPLFRVMISGEVRSPNMYALPPSTTVAEAVALAGGVTERGRPRSVRLLRDGRTETVDLTRPYSELADLRIRSGDQVVVDRHRGWLNTAQPVLTAVGSVASVVLVALRISNNW